jgi:hypothetical protein
MYETFKVVKLNIQENVFKMTRIFLCLHKNWIKTFQLRFQFDFNFGLLSQIPTYYVLDSSTILFVQIVLNLKLSRRTLNYIFSHFCRWTNWSDPSSGTPCSGCPSSRYIPMYIYRYIKVKNPKTFRRPVCPKWLKVYLHRTLILCCSYLRHSAAPSDTDRLFVSVGVVQYENNQ